METFNASIGLSYFFIFIQFPAYALPMVQELEAEYFAWLRR